MQFTLCENTGFYLRLGLLGPSGSGKTYTALKVATELGFERVGILDTENRSARRYARSFGKRFLSLELSHFSPRDYIEALHAAKAQGIEVLVVDSLSHAWMGKGGVLEMVDQSAKRQSRGGGQSSFNGWREVTPEHNRLVEALIQVPMHLIVTMRVKTEYVVEKDQGGKAVPRKVGLAPVQRDGLEYEFDVVGDLSPEHELVITKSRCPQLTDAVLNRPGAELAHTLRGWLDGAQAVSVDAGAEGEAEEAAEPAAEGEAVEAEEAATLQAPAVTPDADAERRAALPPVKAVMPRIHKIRVGRQPAKEGAAPGGQLEELRVITPWLDRIHQAETHGSEEQLDAVREEMNVALRRRTKAQGDALRRAIETARAAIQARRTCPTPEEVAATG